MSETATTTGEGTAPTGTPVPTPPAAPAVQSVESLPQWAQDQISNLRAEAANHRVKARDAAEQAKQSLDTELSAKEAEYAQQVETAKQDAASAQLRTTKLLAVLEAGVPGEHAADLADRVRGENEEEIKGDAKRLKDLLGIAPSSSATDPTQGFGTSNALPLNGDPLMQALQAKLGMK